MKSELRIQQECYMWFYNQYPSFRGLFFKVRNEGTNKVTGAIDKASGLIPGVSDMILLINRTAYFFEFKTETGRQSRVQHEWESLVQAYGYNYHVVRSLKQFKEIICQLGL